MISKQIVSPRYEDLFASVIEETDLLTDWLKYTLIFEGQIEEIESKTMADNLYIIILFFIINLKNIWKATNLIHKNL